MIRQLLAITGFELRSALKRISTWVYFAILFTIGFVMTCAAGGAWEGFDTGAAGRLANSPLSITGTLTALALLTLPITAALFGTAAIRDFQTRMHSLFFTAPISKIAYLGGRFLGALVVNLFILLGAGAGMAVAGAMPFLRADRVGPFVGEAYLQAYVFLVAPNLLFTGALLFTLAAVTRQMLPNYIGGVALLMAYMIAENQLGDLESRETAALLDPMGASTAGLVTRYWTVAERNARHYPYEGLFWANRALWLAVALLIVGILIWRFRFSHAAAERRSRRKGAVVAADAAPIEAIRTDALPRATRHFGGRAQLQQFASTARREFWGIVRSVYFVALLAIGIIFALFMVTQMGEVYDTSTYPVTYIVLESVGALGLFTVIIITFYAGELVWGERELRVSQLHDATPVAGWVPFAAKLVALFGVIVVLQVMTMLVAMGTQLVHGYLDLDLGQYGTTLFVRQLLMYALLAVLAMTIHVLVNHKYVGHFVMILYYVVTPIVYLRLGWEHVLYNYGAGGDTIYSDMNGYGHSWLPWVVTSVYWGVFAVILALLSRLLWVRGEESGTAWRMRLARVRATRSVRIAAGFACLLFLLTGGFVFYNTNVLNEYTSSKDAERMAAEFEKRYGRYEGLAQPRVVGVDLDVDIRPMERDLSASGVYRLRNRTAGPIQTVHVNYPADATGHRFELDREAEAEVRDDEYGYHVYRLARPLAPGDSMRLTWTMEYDARGFTNSVENYGTVYNGTFFHNTLFPTIGYSSRGELRDDDARRRQGLEPKASEPAPDDAEGRMNNYISSDADWIDFAATVSTDPDQIAMAPGYLQREWMEDGRRHFRYEMDAPILNFYSFLSARYEVRKDRWRDVAIEIYHHPEHDFNLDRMFRATKRSLEYYTANYGPYPHRQLRIVEFPRYQTFAQAFPNTVPFSEAIGFIAKVDEDDVDYVFHTTAHEVAHQWWAHQVIGGAVKGSTLLSESLAEFTSLMVMEKEYGEEGIKKFLRYELEGYLTGRASEREGEVPLVRMSGSDQPYLRYNKGALAFYALRDYIGEDRLNQALRGFLEEVKYQEPPYTNSLELIEHLRAATPDSLQYVITDLFETITLYENRATAASATSAGEGRWAVEIELEAKKVRADSLGNQTDVEMADWIDIGVFAEPADEDEKLGAPLYLRKHRIPAGKQTIRVVVAGEPARAGIDPYHRLIDRRMDDNTVPVKLPEQ